MLREKRLGVKYNEKYYSSPDWDKYKSFLTEMATYKLGNKPEGENLGISSLSVYKNIFGFDVPCNLQLRK